MAPPRRTGCVPDDHPPLDRRHLLQVGGLSLFQLGWSDVLRGRELSGAKSPLRSSRAKGVIFIFQSGGPSQLETVDPKPEAPEGIRGEYGVTQTSLPGIQFCEHLPRLSTRLDRFSIVRTMRHVAGREFRNEHNSCQYLLNTGTVSLPPTETNASIALPREGSLRWPSLGAIIAHAQSQRSSGLPAVVEIPRAPAIPIPGTGTGMLSSRYARWRVDLAPPCHAPDPAGSCPHCFSHDDPNDPVRAAGKGPQAWWDNSSCRQATFRLPDLGTPGIAVRTLERRESLLKELEQWRRRVERGSSAMVELPATGLNAFDAYHDQALRLLLTAQSGKHNPFDLSQESERTRDLYGREEWGQAFLVARRLIEAGVKMVQVNLRGWDTHQNAFRDLKGKLLPSLDHCLSGFLDDLQERGLLDEILVVMCGEMGRTPQISPIAVGGRNASGEIFTPGRHHWGDVFPCWFAGGGIQPGRVIGRTDRHAAGPVTNAFTPADLAATIFHLLGIDLHQEFHDASGRAYAVYQGTPIQDLL